MLEPEDMESTNGVARHDFEATRTPKLADETTSDGEMTGTHGVHFDGLTSLNRAASDSESASGTATPATSASEGFSVVSPSIEAERMPLAIIGMACRLPGDVTTPAELWELCSRNRSGWSEIPKDRFSAEGFFHPNPQKLGAFNCKGAHFLSQDLAIFDAPFFNITAAEATAMDPQQRLALECTFEALESAGIPRESISGQPVGVFAGGSFADYELANLRDLDTAPSFQATGNHACMLANKLSYYFDCRGPSFTADTACSASLTALHLASQSLRNGESKMAIVAGSHLNILPDYFVSMSNSQLFNESGKSFPFDHRAESGFARGEGTGVVILKPLDEAVRANDPVRAVLVNTGVNQDGKTAGITSPNGKAQEALIRQVYSSANISLADCGFVEAHGTGTKVGDPIEATAIHNTFGKGRTPRQPLYIGSVKSNVGHLEGASGIISFVKAAMMLERGLVLPNINFEKANPQIPMQEWNMKVPTSVRPWPKGKKYISVCNYGFGGGNAHAVLEKAPPSAQRTLNDGAGADTAPDQKWLLYVLSANSQESLDQKAKDLGVYLEQRPEAFEKLLAGNLAYTLGQRRSHLAWKYAVAATSSDELGVRLAGTKFNPQRAVQEPKIGFVCTGQGAQWAGMGRELAGAYPEFDKAMAAADKHLQGMGAPFSLAEELSKSKEQSRIDVPEITQPACTAVQCALINLFRSWNIEPTITVGHSSGEIAAAYAAGMLSLKSSMTLAYFRGKATVSLKQRHPELKGAMLAVGASADTVRPMLNSLKNGYATIACVNSPVSVTVSGDDRAVSEVQVQLDEKSIFNRRLRVDVAYHSSHMAKVSDEYERAIRHIQPLSDTKATMHSSLLGRIVTASELQPSYWVANLTSPVEFNQGVQSIFSSEKDKSDMPNIMLEVGPHPQLEGPTKDIMKNVGERASKIAYLSSLVRNKDANETMLQAAASLYMKGAPLSMQKINFPQKKSRTPIALPDLPKYPWSHNTRFWHHARIAEGHCHRRFPRNDLLGSLADYSEDLAPTWRNILRLDDMPWLRQHKMQGMIIFPMTGYLVMTLEAAGQRAKMRDVSFKQFELREVVSSRALILDEGSEVEINIQLRPYSEGTRAYSDDWDEFRISSYSQGKGWVEHCRGLVGARRNSGHNSVDGSRQLQRSNEDLMATIGEINTSANEAVDASKLYNTLESIGASYGPHFRSFENGVGCDTHSHAELIVPDTKADMPHQHETPLVIHPGYFDQFMQLVWPIFGAGRNLGLQTLYMPSSIKRVRLSPSSILTEPGHRLKTFAKGCPNRAAPYPTKFNIWATRLDEEAPAIIEFEDLVMTPLIDAGSQALDDARELCYKMQYEPAFEDDKIRPSTPTSSDDGEVGIAVTNALGTPPIKHRRQRSAVEMANGIVTPIEPPETTPVAIVGGIYDQATLVFALSQSIKFATSKEPEIVSFEELDPVGKVCLVVTELEQPLLTKLDSTGFQRVQNMLTKSAGVLWVVRGAHNNSTSPDLSMVTGLSRSIRSETMLKFVTLDLDRRPVCNVQADISAIMDVMRATWITENPKATEFEYTEREGKLLVPRVVNDTVMNKFVLRETREAAPFLQPFAQADRQLKLKIGIPGALDTLHFVDDDKYKLALKEDEVEINVKATGMNFKDIVISMGQVPSPYIGVECSGVISRVGSNVTNVKPGDRVMAMSEGAYSTYTRCLASSVTGIPNDMSFESASTIPVVFCTAYYALMDLGRLEAEDKVLIHAAAGGVGQAAIILAKMIGAEIFATVGSPAKKQFIMQQYGIPEHRIFYSRDASFGPGIRRETNGKGVDVVINSLAGDILRETWECLAHFGRFIEIGKRDILNNTRLEMTKFEHNATFSSVDLTVVAAEKPRIMKRLMSEVVALLSNKTIKPIQLVIVANPQDKVNATANKSSSDLLRSDATYIIVGGTGGLGRSMARWMSMKGARHIVLLSRSGNTSSKVQDLAYSLGASATGVKVVACDIADPEQVARLVKDTQRTMPPIRGIVHGAMVLKDILFERMTHEDYMAVVNSKVPGAWNLHNAIIAASLPLDFFICLSSVAGIVGNRGQAAYAAANTFLDAFCAYRNTLDLPATAIGLTAVSGVGYLAEQNAERRDEVLQNLGGETLDESEVLALIGAAISGTMAQSCNGQCITGLKVSPSTKDSFWVSEPKFTHLREAAAALEGSEDDANAASKPLPRQLEDCTAADDVLKILYPALVEKLSAVLMLPKEDMSPETPVTALGLDSLVAIEVRNWIVRECDANLQVLELLSSTSLMALTQTIVRKSKLNLPKTDAA
ncbi:MAG: hypothetical protein Q9159_003393 [Coniocarpon cinnabarinum]